jgi:hypothetical protein
MPAAFVAARRPDGRPQLSHGWCRTIDGVQGATWTEVHLLGTAALDRYRGYVGQSRARAGTHTWNTRAPDPGDHGGRLVHPADNPSEEVAVATQRAQPKTFAALDDSYRLAPHGTGTGRSPRRAGRSANGPLPKASRGGRRGGRRQT